MTAQRSDVIDVIGSCRMIDIPLPRIRAPVEVG